jgi:serine/threonine-protein kinase
MSKDPNSGRLLAKRYELVDLIGEGAMGRVYRAKDTLLGGVTVAVKFLSQTLLSSKMRERFEREATISAILGEQSIHVVRVRDYGVDENDIPFYVMEFLKGENLSDIVKYQPLPLSRFLSITRQICLGMQTAHQGILFNGELCKIIHRDIKPGNMLVMQDQSLGELVKILDFGIAKLILSSESQTQSFMGTLAYCSPEQMEGKELDNRSDIYSLGVMMYEMLTCEMPLLPDTSSFGSWYKAHHEFKPESFDAELNLPDGLQKLVMKCLAKSPKDRPQTIAEILPVLESLQKDLKRSNNKTEQFPISFDSARTIVNPQKNLANDERTVFNNEERTVFNEDKAATAVSLVEDICWQTSWPKDRPVQKIVFPNLIPSPLGFIPALYTMLDYGEILNLRGSIRYNQFLFLSAPHPMALWITVLYNRGQEPRWLPCYLDLKVTRSQQIVRLLADSRDYRVLFFDINDPQECRNVMICKIDSQNCQLLKEWATISQLAKSNGQPQMTKNALKQEFDKIKPRIIQRIQTMKTDRGTSFNN